MINQQMLDYVKQQTQASREQIKNSLMANGWQPQEIEEAFNALNLSISVEQNPVRLAKPATVIWKIVTISLIGVIIVGGGIYFALQNFSSIEENPELSNQQSPQEVKTPVQTSETTTSSTAEKNFGSEITDCGTTLNFQNFDCFVNAAKNCSPAKITNSTQINLFGMTTAGAASFEIKGQQENKCMFYIRTMSGNVTFSQELIQKMLSSGATNEQIKQREQESSKMAQSTIGRDGTCGFSNTNDLVNLLNKWKEGNFSTEDFQGIDCKGEYFGQSEQLANTSKTTTDQECSAQKGYVTAVTDAGTACFKNQIDLGAIVGSLKMNDKYPQCCVSE